MHKWEMERMETVKILLIAIGGYGANYMKELTEKNVTNAKIEGICEVMPGIEKRFPIINEKNISLYQNIEDFYHRIDYELNVIHYLLTNCSYLD